MIAALAALALVGVAAAAPTSWDGKSALPANTGGGKNWVLLVAGSNTYDNYRHQSGAWADSNGGLHLYTASTPGCAARCARLLAFVLCSSHSL